MYQVEYPKGTFYTGYWALCAALKRAIEGPNPLPLLDANFMANVDDNIMETIFTSSNGTECPLLKERTKALKEAGTILLRDYDGKVSNILKEANFSAKKFLEIITSKFSSYRDQTIYKGRDVFIWKVLLFN